MAVPPSVAGGGPSMSRVLLITNSMVNLTVHRTQLVEALIGHGYEVHVACPPDHSMRPDSRLKMHSYPLARGGMNPFKEVLSLVMLRRIIRKVEPDIVHAFAIKPVLYGLVAAQRSSARVRLFSFTGLGHLFITDSVVGRVIRRAIVSILRLGFRDRRAKVIVQNVDDAHMLRTLHLVDPTRLHLIRGSGVDVKKFDISRDANVIPHVVFAGRLLAEKGILELIEASRILRSRGFQPRVILVGDFDEAQPTSIPREAIATAVRMGVVEWWGWRNDIATVIANADICCLPSYREGLPRFLMEAAAAGKAIVATDVPGCREVVVHERTGLLVPPRDPVALAVAIERLLRDPELRSELGQRAKRRATEEFDSAVFASQMLKLYEGP